MISLNLFKNVFIHCKDPEGWLSTFEEILPAHNINTKSRVICFLAQCGHESMEFTALRENLNYSEKGLLSVFPKYFNSSNVIKYIRKPEMIANKVYSNRMGNGDENSGDGFKYRGGGLIHLTFKDNYAACSKDVYGDDRLVKTPSLLEEKEGAILSACWFWNKNNLNDFADNSDMTKLTKKINGGLNGLEGRMWFFNKLNELLK